MAKEVDPGLVRQIDETTFEVESETSSQTYHVRINMPAHPNDTCSCTAYAIARNRAGGAKAVGTCKHINAAKKIAESSGFGLKAKLVAMAKDLRPEDNPPEDVPTPVGANLPAQEIPAPAPPEPTTPVVEPAEKLDPDSLTAQLKAAVAKAKR